MTEKEAIRERHSVRQYLDKPINPEAVLKLEEYIAGCNADSGLHIQLIQNDPDCFDTFLAHYGKFSNANHYIALAGSKQLPNLEERSGYYGQKIVLYAQTLGLRTCWVGGTFGRGKCKAKLTDGEKLVCVISIGYGKTDGAAHKSKSMEKLCAVPESDMPAWFREGVDAAMMAPTAINQQKFLISLDNETPVITAGKGIMTMIDLGIVKYNFEAASGHTCK